MTISSSEALPARSPKPLIVHSAWRAPFLIAESVLITDMPKSSWQWTLIMASPLLGTSARIWAISAPNSSGTA